MIKRNDKAKRVVPVVTDAPRVEPVKAIPIPREWRDKNCPPPDRHNYDWTIHPEKGLGWWPKGGKR